MRTFFMITVAAAALAGCGQKSTAASPAPTAPESANVAPVAAADEEIAIIQDAMADKSAAVGNARTFVDAEGVAINGYDPVSYFKGAPGPGDAAFVSVLNGASYRFASAENKAAFDADPVAFAPQFGGYCAYGAAKGAKFTTIPETGTIVDGKLYFNKNLDVQKLWNKDQPALIVDANAKWPSIIDDNPA